MKKNKIPTVNYIYLLLIFVGVLVLSLYIKAWYKAYRVDKLSISPLNDVVEKIDIKDMEISLSEMNEVILYFGYINDEKIYKMENRIISFIKNEDVVDKFIYIDASEYKENNKYKEIIKSTFDTDVNLTLPLILYIKNGVVVDRVEPENGLIQTYQLKNLIDKYDLSN